MLDNLILIPIGTSIHGKLIPQLLKLQEWCLKNNSEIKTITGMMHNFARNYLATSDEGFVSPKPPNANNLIWIDSDIVYTIEQLETLINNEHKFCAGWYRSNETKQVMAGYWDLKFFEKNYRMPFLSADWLYLKEKNNPLEPIEVDFTGFGFVKTHRSIFEKMKYPYFTLNTQEIGGYRDLSSEDVSFCQNCIRDTQIKPVIIPKLHVGHLKYISLT